MDGLPGNGGIDRGRGDAAMIWGSESPGRTEAFEPRQLPSAPQLDASQSTLLGVTAAEPQADPTAEAAGLRDTESAAARSAWRRRLAPAHREAVKRFFAPPGGGEKK